ncbi:PDZ domain-containing protein [Microlunatus elymi]|uniref:PDZ domain-containing protein n=1 Tax=Microlunatus elymi TaxID=2596828 RepID=A0A516Q2E7_9ACTN|nr:trypsin-like peptidase domain-containing protein [Microlunatus elymi]QDP97381.1 PDZ domain-containing protein [Microlunatus elymi]
MAGLFTGTNAAAHPLRKPLRRLAAAAGAGVLMVGLAVGPASAATTRLVDAGGYGSPYGWGYGSGGSQSSGTSTTQSDPASTSESRGVVLIDTELYDGSGAAGTGIVLTSGGKILTNYHVVEGSTSIKVTVASTGATYTATLVGADQSSDVAVLQLKKASGLTTADLDEDQVAVGDNVTAVGNAGGTGELSAADGQVTSLNADITTAAEDTVKGESLTGMIETDADVVAGDSGGPLLDSQGEVVGIDTAASSGSQIDGYAIPIDNALKIVDQINAGNETSQVRIGPAAYLGVEVSDSSAQSAESGGQSGWGDQYGYNDPFGGAGTSGAFGGSGSFGTQSTTGTSGAAVVGVEDGTPAVTAGLAAGDVITGVGSTTIGSASALTDALAKHQPGDQVKITWIDSNGDQQSATVTLGDSPIN